MHKMKKLSRLLLLGLLFFHLFILLSEAHWFFELFSHFLLYALALSVLLFITFLRQKRWTLLLILLPLLAWQLAELNPYAIPQEPSPNTDFTVLSQNFYLTNTNYKAFQTLIEEEEPDCFAVLEISTDWDVVLGQYEADYPYQHLSDHRGPFGSLMACKSPAIFSNVDLAGYPAIQADLLVKDQVVTLLAVHPPPPGGDFEIKRDEVLTATTNYAAQIQGPLIIMGDFNSSPWSPIFKKLLAQGKLRDSRLGYGLESTWSRYSLLLKIPIDHILISEHFAVHNFRLGRFVGSDHLAPVAELDLL